MIATALLALAAIAAPEAQQGVAVDAQSLYAISSSGIARYDRRTQRKVAQWQGDPRRFPHLNSCAVVAAELICAASNYPAVPMASRIEIFDAQTLEHRRSHALGRQFGSLTALDWHDGAWWAVFANYDGKGGEKGRNHRATVLVRMDSAFRPADSWLFPQAVLARFAPRSCSGVTWGADGLLYASGHDRAEVYALRLPTSGSVLDHVATLAMPTAGQAIDWDPEARILWSIDRAGRRLVGTHLPDVKGKAAD